MPKANSYNLQNLFYELRLITLRIVVILASLSLLGGIWLWSTLNEAVTDRSLTGLLNKAAVFFEIAESNEKLVAPDERYADLKMPPPTIAHPRILLPSLSTWDGEVQPEVITYRLNWIKNNRERFRLTCDNRHLIQRTLCVLRTPNEKQLKGLISAFKQFRLSQPHIDGRYGNSWELAVAVDLVSAIPQFPSSMLTHAQGMVREALTQHLVLLDGNSASLWHGRATLAATAFLLASVADSGDETGKQLYSRAFGHFSDLMTALEATETWPEGYNYWLQSRGLLIALGLSAYAHTMPAKESERARRLSYRIGLWHIYLTRPDNRIEGWGDEGSRVDLREGTRRIIDVLASTSRSEQLYRYSLYLKNTFPKRSYYHGRLWQPLLFHDPSISTHPLGDVTSLEDVMGKKPSAELFGEGFSNHLIIRSGWGKDDTFITFRASDIFTHHQHYDAGHFTLFKKKPLISNASNYNGLFTANRLNFSIRTVAKNSLLIHDSEEVVKPNHFFETNVIDGGQRIVLPTGSAIQNFQHWLSNRFDGPYFATSELLSFERIEDIGVYLQVDITKAYNSIRYSTNSNAKAKRVVRGLLYLYEQDVLIIKDKVVTTNADHAIDWVFHTHEPAVLSDVQVVMGAPPNGVTQGLAPNNSLTFPNRDLTLKILKPDVANITQFGGDDYRFFIPSPSPLKEGENYQAGSSDARWFDHPKWRIHINAPSRQQEVDFLILIAPGESSALNYRTVKDEKTSTIQFNKLRIAFISDCNYSTSPDNNPKKTIYIFNEECNGIKPFKINDSN